MYSTRILPPDEYDKIAASAIPGLVPYVRPETMQVCVVEDDGRVVGAWAVVQMTHLEGLWIDPEYRHKSGVARRLWLATFELARRGTAWAMTAAITDDIRHLLTKHVGAVSMPGEIFIVPVKGRT